VTEPRAAGVGALLRAARERAGLTQEALGAAAGITQAAVSRWESGERELGVTDLLAAASALGCSPASLLPVTAAEPAAAGRPARVELMGYRQHIGRVREVTLAGAPMLALSAMDGPEIVFPASSVYCITWLAEASLEAFTAAGRGEDPRCPVHGDLDDAEDDYAQDEL
jgi:transcriptional regulator with XRE-family HTH domain